MYLKVKVSILMILLNGFVGQTIAKYSEFDEPIDRGVRKYPEFIDDEPEPEYGIEENRRSSRDDYVDEPQRKLRSAPPYREDVPYYEEYETDNVRIDENLRRSKRHDYKESRYDQNVEETRPEPQRVSRGSKKTTQYEVYEINDEEEEPEVVSAESAHTPDVLYHNGVAYVKLPQQVYSSVGRNERKVAPSLTPGAPTATATKYVQDFDQTSSASGKPQARSHAHSHSGGGGHQSSSQHKNTHGVKSDKGYKSEHHVEKGAKGSEGHENHSKKYNELGGNKKSHHDAGGHYGEHHEGGKGQKGGQFDEKKGHKKGHNTKGYHNKYHKDEYHKEHKFYDDYHKSGSHHKYGDFKAQHGSKEGGHHKKAHHDSALDHKDAGKKGKYAKGHVDEAHKGHKNEKGYDKHYSHHSDYGKKGGSQGGKQYGYKTEH